MVVGRKPRRGSRREVLGTKPNNDLRYTVFEPSKSVFILILIVCLLKFVHLGSSSGLCVMVDYILSSMNAAYLDVRNKSSADL